MLQDREALRQLLRERSIKLGKVILASGIQSDIYVDARLTTYTAVGIELVGRMILTRMRELNWKPCAVGGMARGATPVAMATMYESLVQGQPMNAFMTQRNPLGQGKEIEGMQIVPGSAVVIVEDTASTGTSIIDALTIVRSVGLHVIGAICLIDRQMGAAQRLLAEHNCHLHSIFTLDELR